jgi:hypothetical protein
MNAFGNRARYKIVGNAKDQPLLIRDVGPWDQHPSVTNDAEDVVKELVAKGFLPEGRELYYYDSENSLDAIKVKNGVFNGFGPATIPVKEDVEITLNPNLYKVE